MNNATKIICGAILLMLAALAFVLPSCNVESQPVEQQTQNNCSGNYDHLKLSAEDAEAYISDYKTYLNRITIDASAPGTPQLNTPKFEGFKISECELHAIVDEFGPGSTVWAYLGIKDNEPTMIFRVGETSSDNAVYFDFNNPCPPLCDDGYSGLGTLDCSENFDHLKISAQDAWSYINAYQSYLNRITIDASAPGTPLVYYPKVEVFRIPECELETIVSESSTGFQTWATIGIKENHLTLIFEIQNSDQGNWTYFDFSTPCPTCPDEFAPPTNGGGSW